MFSLTNVYQIVILGFTKLGYFYIKLRFINSYIQEGYQHHSQWLINKSINKRRRISFYLRVRIV